MHKKKYVFVADVFSDQVPGGGELNNDEVIQELSKNHTVEKINSHLVTKNYLVENIENNFIISNFLALSEECKSFLTQACKYIIYEHDHKYLYNRNPAVFKDYKAPLEMIVNYDFYKNARKVLCQTNFHASIVEKNLNIDSIVSLGGNLWNPNTLEVMRTYSKREKKDKCSIMNSTIPHKNTVTAVQFCKARKMSYDLINFCPYHDFLEEISRNDKFVFFPKTPETLSRIVVEARMMGMQVITNGLVGATKEEWFELRGIKLIEKMYNKRDEIITTIKEIFNDGKQL